MDACLTSQFEQQARAMAGLPLGGVDLLAPAVMLNILGDIWYESADTDAQREPIGPARCPRPPPSCTCTASARVAARATSPSSR